MNMSPQERPHYKKRSKEASAAHLADLIARERRIQQGKRKK